MNHFNEMQEEKYPESYVPTDPNPNVEADPDTSRYPEDMPSNAYQTADESQVQRAQDMYGYPDDEIDLYNMADIDSVVDAAQSSLIRNACKAPSCCKTLKITYVCGSDYEAGSTIKSDKCGTTETYTCGD
jgi:hypothetical protein